eukprot:TRINITY_DN4067_c0_g1_i3.p1 TRINITY_DN4067_c0_g1~~TRINITY_DN4067_c0_g1_i3.p1  ORF type:complete len:600 (+),score=91.45 TRINITY_DN4067_c0_g1_i3:133-1932(+)
MNANTNSMNSFKSLVLVSISLLFSVVVNGAKSCPSIPKVYLAPPPYPAWAHSHMVWQSHTNQTTAIQLVEEYLSNGIPVGGLDIDDGWETGYGEFTPNSLYPNVTYMTQYMKSLNVSVIFWITSLVDTNSPNYQYGLQNNFYLNNGKTQKWWNGEGSYLDYTNPAAVSWWHSMMDVVLEAGVSGWKTDGTDGFLIEWLDIQGKAGKLSPHDYGHMYYADFFFYTREKIGSNGLIWSRPADSIPPDGNIFYWDYSPRNVSFSCWVGDQDPGYHGLGIALDHMRRSSDANYVNYGSDVGGFRQDSSLRWGRDPEVFIRWAELGCFSPLFENGGEGEHRPWIFGNDYLEIYRRLAVTHTDMGPYFLTTGTDAYESGGSSLTFHTEDSFLLGPDIFVAPVVKNETRRLIWFPSSKQGWVEFWSQNVTYSGDSIHLINAPLFFVPAFFRSGSIIPLSVSSPYSIFGSPASSDALTILITHPSLATSSKTVKKIREPEELGNGLEVLYATDSFSNTLDIMVSAHSRNILFLITGLDNPKVITDLILCEDSEQSLPEIDPNENFLDVLRGKGRGFVYDNTLNRLWIRAGVNNINQAASGIWLKISF